MIIDTANALSASFETEGQNGEFAITFKSRGGSGDAAINPDYMPGLLRFLKKTRLFFGFLPSAANLEEK